MIRTSAIELSTSDRSPIRLRRSTAAVLPDEPDVPLLQHFERNRGRLQQVAEFVDKKAQPRAFPRTFASSGLAAVMAERGDRVRDGIVQASVQRAEFVCVDRGVGLHRNFRDGLTHVAVVVNHLSNRKPALQKVLSVQSGAAADFRVRLLVMPQHLDELIEKERHSVIDFRFGGCGDQPRRHLGPAPFDDFVAVHGDECVEHSSESVSILVI